MIDDPRRRIALIRRVSSVLAVGLTVILPAVARASCAGDCNRDGIVVVAELLVGVRIALERSPLQVCPSFDANADGMVSMDEIVQASREIFAVCPPDPTPTVTASPASTATPSPTPTQTLEVNHPPVPPTPSIYRTYPGFEIALPLGVTDPDGQTVTCTATDPLPAGAALDEPGGLLTWTPTVEQLGPFSLPFSCADDATPPESVDTELTVKVSPRDSCAIPSCDPALGCTAALPGLSENCCTAEPVPRVAEPSAGCPHGRVLFVGQNADLDSFGRLQNCDTMRVRNFAQSGAELQFHVEVRCVNLLNRVRVRARMESNAEFHPILFDVETRPFFLAEDPDGFARQRGLRFSIGGGGPFFDLQDAEANLTVTLIDSDNVSVTERVRVRLGFTPQPDRPDVDPTPPPTATPSDPPATATP